MDLRERIAEYPDFPKKGILFRDFGPMLGDPGAVSQVLDELAAHFDPNDYDVLAGIESRGFILACAMAVRYGKGMVMIRKAGKLPGRLIRQSYSTEYGEDTMVIQDDSIPAGRRVLICDDLLATGGTAAAAAKLVEEAGGKVAGFAFIIELVGLGGAARISRYDSKSLVKY